jgi:hypothetical protein
VRNQSAPDRLAAVEAKPQLSSAKLNATQGCFDLTYARYGKGWLVSPYTDVPERISDATTGHTTPGIGRNYEHVEIAKKFKAVSKLPVNRLFRNPRLSRMGLMQL